MECRLGIYEKALPSNLTWEEKFAAVKEVGFDFFEISIDETDEKLGRLDMTADQKNQLCAWMKEYDMYIESMCLSGHRRFPIGSENKQTRIKGMEIMQKAIVFARDIGVRMIQIAGYDVYYENSTERTVELFAGNLNKCIEFAAQYGVMLAFETMETEFLNTVEKAMKWVREINSPYLMVYPDSGNITNAAKKYRTDVIEDLISGKGYIAAVHLKETIPGKYREIPYGTGHVPFEKIIKKSYDIGIRRFLAEFWYEGDANWKREIQNAYDFLEKYMR